jgi:hypothetical protein
MDNTIKMKFTVLIALIVAIAQNAIAQSFPVSITPTIYGPYSPYLSDYTEPGSQKLLVNILMNDPVLTEYRCKLRLTIEGVGITIRTRQRFIPQVINLTAGAPNILYGEDLAEYFNPANLDFAGISKGDYTKGAKLLEGIYRFSFEVLDYNRGTVVSNKGTAMAWIILNDPPLLAMPRKDTKVAIVDPTNIAFSWTPRHTGSPNSAFTTEYVFRLVEIWPAGRNSYDAFRSQQPLYEITTNFTQIVYGPAEPALIAGRKYAWQVQAKDTDGKDLFKNEGKSEVYVFQFGDAIGVPQNFRKEGGNSSVLNLRWEPAPDGAIPQQYRVRYRKKGDTQGIWYESVTPQLWIAIPDLQRDTEYDMQIRAEAVPQYSDYSQLATLKTNAVDDVLYECGEEDVPISVNTSSLLMSLPPGTILTAAGDKIKVIKATGSNGNFTGEGWMHLSYLNGGGVRITFSGQINNNYEFTSLAFETIYHKGSVMAQAIDDANNIGEEPKPSSKADSTTKIIPDYTVPGTIDSIYVKDDGKIVAVDTDGHESTYDQKKDKKTKKAKETVIADASGNSYTVAEDGKVTRKSADTTNDSPAAVPQNNFEKLVKSILDELTDINVKQLDSVRTIRSDYLEKLEAAITNGGYKSERYLITGNRDQYITEGFSKQITESLQKSKSLNFEDQKIIAIEDSYVDLYISDTVLVVKKVVAEKIDEYKRSSFAPLVKEMQQMLNAKTSKEREPLEEDKEKLKLFLADAIRIKLRM